MGGEVEEQGLNAARQGQGVTRPVAPQGLHKVAAMAHLRGGASRLQYPSPPGARAPLLAKVRVAVLADGGRIDPDRVGGKVRPAAEVQRMACRQVMVEEGQRLAAEVGDPVYLKRALDHVFDVGPLRLQVDGG